MIKWMAGTQRQANTQKPLKQALGGFILLLAGVTFSQAACAVVAPANAPIGTQGKAAAAPVTPPPPPISLLRTDFIRLMDADFRKRDLDGNGKATRAEVEEFTKRAANTQAQEQNRALFQRLDTDRNGILNTAEFAALIPAPKFIDVSSEMARFDGNRDQIISLVEYRTTTLANFDRMDADKDGILSASELSKMTASPSNASTELERTR